MRNGNCFLEHSSFAAGIFTIPMKNSLKPLLFVFSLLLLYVFLNGCRRLLVATGPYYISHGVLDHENYGLISSVSSIAFGLCRFLSFQLMDWVPLDKMVMILSLCVSSICALMTLLKPEAMGMKVSSFLLFGYASLSITLGLPFPCSSMVVRRFIPSSCSNSVRW